MEYDPLTKTKIQTTEAKMSSPVQTQWMSIRGAQQTESKG